MKKDIQGPIEEVMQSLEGLQSAEANTFLWSKIKNRMHGAKEVLSQGLAWRMIAALSVIMIVNVITIFGAAKTSTKKELGASLVATEYSITISQTY